MKVRAKPEIHDHVFDEYNHRNLSPNHEYEVHGIANNYYRIINDRSDPILYPNYLFTVTDATIPTAWVRHDYGEGEFAIGPPELSERAFWDHYHDGDPVARAKFRAYLVRIGASPD